MTKHEFIFSDQRRYYLARHTNFWCLWCIAYLLLFHYPIHSFKGWSLSTAGGTDVFPMIGKIGITLYILKTFVFSALLPVVVPQALFTYILINWILPQYFYRKRNPIIVAVIIIVVLVSYYYVAGLFKWFNPIGNYIFGLQKNVPIMNAIPTVGLHSAAREQLSSLPVVAGFAVMIKIIKRWYLKQKETEQLAKEKARAELQLLKAQIHPHFLFNTLNNIYFFTLSGSPKAPEMINKLSRLLHYILNECNQRLVPLEKEIEMIRDYMALEKIRYGEQMKMTVDIPGNCSGELIAPLLLIPFVENSFKHGTSKMIGDPWLKLQIKIEESQLLFFLSNSRPTTLQPLSAKGNIGLKNVRKRLQLLYPGTHDLSIVSDPESFTVTMKIQLQQAKPSPVELINSSAYEMA
jgi:sensor histidine kinase YesM